MNILANFALLNNKTNLFYEKIEDSFKISSTQKKIIVIGLIFFSGVFLCYLVKRFFKGKKITVKIPPQKSSDKIQELRTMLDRFEKGPEKDQFEIAYALIKEVSDFTKFKHQEHLDKLAAAQVQAEDLLGKARVTFAAHPQVKAILLHIEAILEQGLLLDSPSYVKRWQQWNSLLLSDSPLLPIHDLTYLLIISFFERELNVKSKPSLPVLDKTQLSSLIKKIRNAANAYAPFADSPFESQRTFLDYVEMTLANGILIDPKSYLKNWKTWRNIDGKDNYIVVEDTVRVFFEKHL